MWSYLDDVGLALAVAASEHGVDGGGKTQVVRDAESWPRPPGAGVHQPEELTWGSEVKGQGFTWRGLDIQNTHIPSLTLENQDGTVVEDSEAVDWLITAQLWKTAGSCRTHTHVKMLPPVTSLTTPQTASRCAAGSVVLEPPHCSLISYRVH